MSSFAEVFGKTRRKEQLQPALPLHLSLSLRLLLRSLSQTLAILRKLAQARASSSLYVIVFLSSSLRLDLSSSFYFSLFLSLLYKTDPRTPREADRNTTT